MTNLTPDDANQMAHLLNQICSATLEALQSDDAQQRRAVADALNDLHAQVSELPEIATFIEVLVGWLHGTRPDDATLQRLDGPYRRALAAMLQDAPSPPSSGEQEPISRHVLAQLVSAVVIAEASGDVEVQRRLAAQLVNIQAQLDRRWRKRLGPLLENLRSVLGGVDSRALPMPDDPTARQLWSTARDLLLTRDFSEETAEAHLLDRLVHNATFALRARNPELIEALSRSLLDVQRQALATEATDIAMLVGAIRAHLQGLDATPIATMLEGEALVAWQQITEDPEPSP